MMERLIQRIQQDWAKRDQELVNYIIDIIKKQNLSGQISFIEQQKQILSHLYQKAGSYTNLVMLAGYAGIFGIWQFTRELLSKHITIWVAILVSSSLILFVGYEVWKMTSEALFLRRLDKVINKQIAEQDRMGAWQLSFVEFSRRQSRIWPYFFIPTVLLGFSAAFLLISQFIIKL